MGTRRTSRHSAAYFDGSVLPTASITEDGGSRVQSSNACPQRGARATNSFPQ